jgi:hypothetical protein
VPFEVLVLAVLAVVKPLADPSGGGLVRRTLLDVAAVGEVPEETVPGESRSFLLVGWEPQDSHQSGVPGFAIRFLFFIGVLAFVRLLFACVLRLGTGHDKKQFTAALRSLFLVRSAGCSSVVVAVACKSFGKPMGGVPKQFHFFCPPAASTAVHLNLLHVAPAFNPFQKGTL